MAEMMQTITTAMPTIMQSASALMPILGGSMTANAQLDQGIEVQRAAYWQAYQLDVNATKTLAAMSVDVESAALQFDLVASRARAVAGGQGTGLDGQVADIIAEISAVGRYEMDKIIFSGQDTAHTLNTQAAFKRYEGDQARKGSRYSAGATLMAGMSQSAINWFGAGKTGILLGAKGSKI